ncbi:MAG: hypothetical protein JNK50_06080 [Bacteroidia bacterium]|nr:hypothetical protein [Bacteroidia bacterium]
MSEISLITKRYDDIVDFTSKVNKSVIVFKKKTLLNERGISDKYPKLKLKQEEVDKAEAELLDSLLQLEQLAKETEYSNKLTGLSESSVLRQMVFNNETDRKEIESIIQNLKEHKPFEKFHFVMLDKIISALDNERNLLFRKLRTARG